MSWGVNQEGGGWVKRSGEEILQVINENFIEMLLDMVNQNVQEALKKFQDKKKIKNMRKHKNK
jgi:hypothetical protein